MDGAAVNENVTRTMNGSELTVKVQLQRLPLMSAADLRVMLDLLGINVASAAFLLGVTERTVRRWLDGTFAITGGADAAIRAWVALHHRRMAWMPIE